MTGDEPRYTLDEAAAELARRECEQRGHDWTMHAVRTMDSPGEVPIAIGCERPCGHPGFDVRLRRADG
ncbi:hypothetical protein JOL79_06825 [Microbispora sp. RL4-1S]|uniref:Uncharacterized protein n=1 Tax=Microbispora oryzae TaxID=2806554 RepID=A0A941AGZ5_9ACTN|nr:hypothetical protein [Microbispora oryzae]MBP2703511.1 hypothetical protein [Microbispora oryzae]